MKARMDQGPIKATTIIRNHKKIIITTMEELKALQDHRTANLEVSTIEIISKIAITKVGTTR